MEEKKGKLMDYLDRQNPKNQKFVIDKIFHPLDVHFDTNSLPAWMSDVHVKGAPEKTEQAKKKNLSKFMQFFQMGVGRYLVDSWIQQSVSISKSI